MDDENLVNDTLVLGTLIELVSRVINESIGNDLSPTINGEPLVTQTVKELVYDALRSEVSNKLC